MKEREKDDGIDDDKDASLLIPSLDVNRGGLRPQFGPGVAA